MSLRYLIEALIFLGLLITFQLSIQKFNGDALNAVEELVEYSIVRQLLTEQGIPIYGVDYYGQPEEIESNLSELSLSTNATSAEIEESLTTLGNATEGRRILEGEEETVDLSSFSPYELMLKQYEIQNKLIADFKIARDDLALIEYLTIGLFMFPIAFFCKYIYSRLTRTTFFITSANVVDFICFILTCTFWVVTDIYDHRDLRYPIFNPVDDQISYVRFMGNAIQDISDDYFHYDFLLAAITAMLWFRIVIMMRLTSNFGPVIVMISNMISIVLNFLVLYIIGIFTFACVAHLTLAELESFDTIFNALRTYVMASLGNFDIIQYDVLGVGYWKTYYGVGLHVVVLFYNMLIIVNLLIAIMSDGYGALSEVRQGLYWATVIQEMPKY